MGVWDLVRGKRKPKKLSASITETTQGSNDCLAEETNDASLVVTVRSPSVPSDLSARSSELGSPDGLQNSRGSSSKRSTSRATSARARFGRSKSVLRRHESSFLDGSNIESEDEGDGEEEQFMIDEVPPTSLCCSCCQGNKFKVTLFVLGLVFIGIGLIFEFVWENENGSRAFLIIGAILCCGLLGKGIVLGLFWSCNLLMRKSSSDQTTRSLSTFLYYLSATRASDEQALWALLNIFVVLGLVPYESSSLVIQQEWELATFHLTRVFSIAFLLFVARALTTTLRIYFSQTFNTRAYHERVVQTMYYEHLLNTLLNRPANPWFRVMYNKLDTSTIFASAWAIPTSDTQIERERQGEEVSENIPPQAYQPPEAEKRAQRLDPRTWQHLCRYINSHHVDGTELPDGFKHVQVGAQEDMDAFSVIQSKKIAKKLFDRLFAFCEARRAVYKARKGPPKRTLSGSDLSQALENYEPNNNNSTGSESKSSKNLDRDLSKSVFLRDQRHLSEKLSETATIGSESNAPSSKLGRNVSGGESRRGRGFLSGSIRTSTSQGLGQLKKVVDRRKIRKKDFMPLVHEYYGAANIDSEGLWRDLLDPSGTGYTNLRRFNMMVSIMFKGRRNISITLQDSQSVIHSLDIFIMAAFMIILTMVALALYKVDVIELWVGLSGALLAWSFVFGSSVRIAFEAIVFLFAVHPYDVGDCIEIGPTQERYEVRRIHLYSTELLRWDGSLTVMENRHIWEKVPIFNYSTSENKGLVQRIAVDLDCITDEFLDGFRKDLVEWLASKPDSFTMQHIVNARDWRNPLKCDFVIYVEHAYPNYSLDRTLRDQDLLMRFVCSLLVKYGVRYSGTGLGRLPFPPQGTVEYAESCMREANASVGGRYQDVSATFARHPKARTVDASMEEPFVSAETLNVDAKEPQADGLDQSYYSPSGRRYSTDALPTPPLTLLEKKDQ